MSTIFSFSGVYREVSSSQDSNFLVFSTLDVLLYRTKNNTGVLPRPNELGYFRNRVDHGDCPLRYGCNDSLWLHRAKLYS